MRTNTDIDAVEVLVISDTGEQLGVMLTSKALSLADDEGLDLVEVSPNVVPPVCKLMDYGKYVYEQDKKEKKNRKDPIQTKELRFRPNIQEHDVDVKVNQARKFLTGGKKVRLVMQYKNREISNNNTFNRGKGILEHIIDELHEVSILDVDLNPNEDSITAILAPN